MTKKKISKIKITSVTYLLFVYAILIMSSTYAYEQLSAPSNNTITGQGGCSSVNYTGQYITVSSISSTDDYINGAKSTVTLSKDASCTLYTEANIYIYTDSSTTAPVNTVPALKYKVFYNEEQISEGTITSKEDYLVATVPLTNNAMTYTVYLYLDSSASAGEFEGKSYSGYVHAQATQTSTIEGNYQVTFNQNNNDTITLKKTVTNGQPYGWLPTPAKTGYTFTGWKLSSTNITSNTTVSQTADHTLTAQWSQDSYTVTFNPDGGTVGTATTSVNYGSTYGNLPTPAFPGKTFQCWNGKNVLNYNNFTTYATNANISAASNGNISDSTPSSDSRTWSYTQSNWQQYLPSGTYTLSITFSTQCTNSNCYYYIYTSNSTLVSNQTIRNKASITKTFTVTNNNNIGIMIKGYDGVYKVQVERGSRATTWEPFCVTSSTAVTQTKDHILNAVWQ